MQRSVTLSLIAAVVFLVVDVNAQSCRQVFFAQQPGWVTHAEWVGDRLLMLDRSRNEVQTYKQDGRPAPSSPLQEINKALPAYPAKPLELKRQADDWFLRLDPVSFVRVDQEHGASDPLNLVGTSVQVGESMAELVQAHDWVPSGNSLVLLGDLYLDAPDLPDEARKISGVVRLTLSGGQDLRIEGDPVLLGENWQYSDATWRRHRVISPTLAAAKDGRVFFLKLDETPRIYFNDPASNELKALTNSPEEIGAASPPDIPDVSLRKLPLIMAELENTSFVAGLYFWEGHLYVLHREPSRARFTRWSLTKVDAEKGEALDRSTLPTDANHLVVAPGDPWAFVEKDPYLGLGNQKIPSAYLIDADFIREFHSSLCSSGH